MKKRKSTGLKGLTRDERYLKSEKRFLKIQGLVDRGDTIKEACYEVGSNPPFYYQWKKKLGNVKFTTAPIAVKRRKKVAQVVKTALFVGTASELVEIWESL
jgi:hypothetical protein